jgi:hypothetical protein
VDNSTVKILTAGEQGAQGIQGPQGVPGNARIELAFSFGDASPEIIGSIPTNKIVEAVSLFIEVPFDGIGAALSIGDSSNPNSLMSFSQNDPTQVGAYQVAPTVSFNSDTVVKLFITPGAGATQGSGLITIEIQD